MTEGSGAEDLARTFFSHSIQVNGNSECEVDAPPGRDPFVRDDRVDGPHGKMPARLSDTEI
ncbi:MAG: hypothetical protein QOI22_1178 [Verrucomicrobiota bacterium]